MVLRGSDVTLTCSVQMNQTMLASELSLLMVNASLIKPDGSSLDLSPPMISQTMLTYIFTTRLNAFGDTDVGKYTCNATIKPQPPSLFLTGMSQWVSDTTELVIIGKRFSFVPYYNMYVLSQH